MAYKPKVLSVIEGGTGLITTVANQVLYSSASNTLSGVTNGTTGQVFTATTGSAPGWGAAAASGIGYAWIVNCCAIGNPANNHTYFLTPPYTIISSSASGLATSRLYVLAAGTIKAVYGSIGVAGTLGTSENTTISIRLNNTTDTVVSSTVKMNATDNTFNNTALGIAVNAGDYIEVKLSTPIFVTTPTSVTLSMSIYME